jgi:4-hydroxy-tetrahydrodipicolinate reductase
MKKRSLRVAVCGALGRMGLAVRSEIAAGAAFAYAGGVDSGKAGDAGGPATFAALLARADVAVDFSCPAAACAYAAACARAGRPFVTGTTGFSKKQFAALKTAAARVPVLVSPNMSPAVNLTFALARLAAARLNGFDAHISEAHHILKKDAPSGTALRYARMVALARGGGLPPITSVRAGDIVGDHTVLFAGPHERVELTHRAHSRAVFAAGALRAAAWLAGRKPGFYDYFDLLDLKAFL